MHVHVPIAQHALIVTHRRIVSPTHHHIYHHCRSASAMRSRVGLTSSHSSLSVSCVPKCCCVRFDVSWKWVHDLGVQRHVP
jgi:hypothetical protein